MAEQEFEFKFNLQEMMDELQNDESWEEDPKLRQVIIAALAREIISTTG